MSMPVASFLTPFVISTLASPSLRALQLSVRRTPSLLIHFELSETEPVAQRTETAPLLIFVARLEEKPSTCLSFVFETAPSVTPVTSISVVSYLIAKSRPAIPDEGTPASEMSTVNSLPDSTAFVSALIVIASAAETEATVLNNDAVHAVAIKQAAALLNFIIKFLLSKI